MADLAIRAQALSKRYRIGVARRGYRTLRDAVSEGLAATLRTAYRRVRARPRSAQADDTIWALKDVTFEVARGEAVGIIGRNGSGKSTLLKVLSRITRPTTGSAEITGRVGSLLEVGTGFHPELTGRDNIYLNGAILGMKRAEIAHKFDEIVAFAEVERFIDTPVKHYSSGMYLRLAFAVAAHLETEILFVDEVLAVGDATFQNKCLHKMQEAGAEGHTVIFVSHSMPSIQRLCPRAILLDEGRLVADGPSHEITRHYMRAGSLPPSERVWPDLDNAPGDSVARLRSVRVKSEKGQPVLTMDIREPLVIEVDYWNLQSTVKPTAIIHCVNEEGVTLFATNDWNDRAWWNSPPTPGLVRAICRIPGNFLAEGQIFVLAAVGSYNPNVLHAIERDAVSFQVIDRSEGDGARGAYAGSEWPGVVRPLLTWHVEKV